MWKQKLGICVYNSYTLPTTDIIRIIGKTGFDAISPEYTDDATLEEIVRTAEECGLYLQSLHAPYYGAAAMWSNDEAVSAPAKEEIFNSLEACGKYHIPILVVHAWIGFEYQFDKNSLCFKNYDELVARAEELQVKIAFENTEGDEFLFALMERYYSTPCVGFCWDSGHEMCYNHSQDLLKKFGRRLIVTHLNDNLGISRFDGRTFWTDDLHLLPYDGVADWDYNIERLKKAAPLEYLNFELNINSKQDRHENDPYGQVSPEVYFAECYKRACRIAYRYSL